METFINIILIFNCMEITFNGHSQTEIELSQLDKIGEGGYREVFRLNDTYALKVLKPRIGRSYGSIRNIGIPANLYTRLRIGTTDFNQFEYDRYKEFIKRVPNDSRDKFSHIHCVGEIEERSFSISDLVVNSDGSLGRTLLEYDRLDDDNFWRRVKKLEEMLITLNIPILDITRKNIVVKEVEGEAYPVIIDFKSLNRRYYPLQIWLYSKEQLFRKMQKGFQRIKERNQIS